MKSRYILYTGLGLFGLSLLIAMAGALEFGQICAMISALVMYLVYPIALIIDISIHYQELKEKRKARLAKAREEHRLRQHEARKIVVEHQNRHNIIDVKYLGPGAAIYQHGTLSGALWGGFFGGPIGFVVGAMLGSPNPKEGESLQQFAVTYGDGHIEIKELHPNNWEYKKLIQMVKWEDA